MNDTTFPLAHYGKLGRRPSPKSLGDVLPDDDEVLDQTPQDVIDMLGFDPLKESYAHSTGDSTFVEKEHPRGTGGRFSVVEKSVKEGISLTYGGASALLRRENGGYHLTGLKTNSSDRGKGHATILMQHAIDKAKSERANLRLHPIAEDDKDEDKLNKFYHGLGFRKNGKAWGEMSIAPETF